MSAAVEREPAHPGETIRTERMDLRAGTPASLRADLEGAAALARALGVRVPAEWPPDLYDAPAIEYTIAHLERVPPEERHWGFYYFVLRDDEGAGPVAVGCGGFKGAPTDDGTVELGYTVLARYRRRGLATEAVHGFLGRAFAAPEVRRVIAETLPELTPSIGVLEKSGFRFIGQGSEPGVIRFEITRQEWRASAGRPG
ncbi:MAG TPA: GNAT family N-acetyltransferase [Longimicrobiales bacterium]|nr:GNAT family N-acetyltransferase [Longimicrobiales bacterium]